MPLPSKTKQPSIMDRLMSEAVRMPGFPQLIVTRHFLYHWLTGCGWSPSERGFASVDYYTFAAKKVDAPLTDETERDYWLNQVRDDYLREAVAA